MLQAESASQISGDWAGYVVQGPKGCATPYFVSVTGLRVRHGPVGSAGDIVPGE